MAWCPNCKTEYRNGNTICADCGATLVETLDISSDSGVVASFIEESTCNKFVDFLNYSNLTGITSTFNKENEYYEVRVSIDDEEQGKKLFRIFKESREKEEATSDSTLEKNDATESNPLKVDGSVTYVKKSQKYEDVKSSAVMFTIFSILIVIIDILSIAKVITLFSTPLQQVVLALIAIVFFVVGITSSKEAKELKGQIAQEDSLTERINEYLQANITKDTIIPMCNPSLSKEVNFLTVFDYIKSTVSDEFQIPNDSYVDQIVEEYYNQYLDD